MDREKMLALADFLDNLPDYKFNMSNWFSDIYIDEDGEIEYLALEDTDEVIEMNSCNTAACIAGWASCLFNDGMYPGFDEDGIRYDEVDAKEFAEKQLGLSYAQGSRLFFWNQASLWHQYAKELGVDLDQNGMFNNQIDPNSLKPATAAKLIRGLVYGEFDWKYYNYKYLEKFNESHDDE